MLDDITLVILGEDRRVAIDAREMMPALPKVRISLPCRLAHSVTIAAGEKYGLELFVSLRVRSYVADQSSSDSESWTLIGRLQNEKSGLPEGLKWCQIEQAGIGRQDRITLDRAIEEFDSWDSGVKGGVFSRYRSFDELRAWYGPILDDLGFREKGIQQWNAFPEPALFRIRVEPRGVSSVRTPRAFWFKAVDERDRRELAITRVLGEECAGYCPKVIAMNAEWNAWLSEEISGQELGKEKDGRPWALTAYAMAAIQRQFFGKEKRLLELGCVDWRMPKVRASLDPFFNGMDEVMRRQPSVPPHILDGNELRMLRARCGELCQRVEDLGVPYSIVHGDFTPRNVMVTDRLPVIIDWAAAYVSFPLLSWEYLWTRMISDHPEHAIWIDRARRNYIDRGWRGLFGTKLMGEALRLSPGLATLIVALRSTGDAGERDDRIADRFRRSLIRRLQRELEFVELAQTPLRV